MCEQLGDFTTWLRKGPRRRTDSDKKDDLSGFLMKFSARVVLSKTTGIGARGQIGGPVPAFSAELISSKNLIVVTKYSACGGALLRARHDARRLSAMWIRLRVLALGVWDSDVLQPGTVVPPTFQETQPRLKAA